MNRPSDDRPTADRPTAEGGARSHYREWAPPVSWRPAVLCRWEQRIDAGVRGAGHSQRVIPDGSADVIVEITTGTATVVGPASRTVRPVLAPGAWYRGLRLRSEALRAVLDVDGASLRDATVPLDALVPGRLARALSDAIAFDADGETGAGPAGASASAGVRPGSPVPAVLNRRLVAAPIDPRVRAAGQLLWRAPAPPVDEVARAIGLSGRQLRRLLLAEVGLGPKTLTRVGRLHRFLGLAERPGAPPGRADSGRAGPDLAGLAVAAGYADQPHLTREVRRLTDLTPVGLLAERRGALD